MREGEDMILADKIMNERKKNGWSQEELADKLGVSLCIISPVLLIVLSGLSDSGLFGISENIAAGVGITVLLVFVAIGVFLFIKCVGEGEKYNFLDKEKIDTAYGVDGMVSDRKREFMGKFYTGIAIGVMLCILSSVPLLISAGLYEGKREYVIVSMVGVLLIIVAVAVNIFVRVGIIKGSYDKLLQQGDYTVSGKKASPIINCISSVYWPVAAPFIWHGLLRRVTGIRHGLSGRWQVSFLE